MNAGSPQGRAARLVADLREVLHTRLGRDALPRGWTPPPSRPAEWFGGERRRLEGCAAELRQSIGRLEVHLAALRGALGLVDGVLLRVAELGAEACEAEGAEQPLEG